MINIIPRKNYFLIVAIVLAFSSISALAADNALLFTGDPNNGTANSYVNIPTNTAFDLTTGTIEMWIKPIAIPPAGVVKPTLIANRNGGSVRYSINIDNLGFIYFYNGTASLGVSAGLTLGTWQHLAVVFGAVSAEVFVNGISKGTISNVPGAATGLPLTFGSTYTGAGYAENFNGAIDEVRVWSSQRTGAQIAANQSVLTDTTGLVARYQLNEGTGTCVASSVGDFATGTASASWVTGVGGATTGSRCTSSFSNMLTFNGTNQYLDLASLIPYNDTTALTIAAWINVASYITYGNLLTIWNSGSSAGLELRIMNDGRLEFGRHTTSWMSIQSPSALPKSRWLHVAATLDSSKNANMYINGTNALVTGTNPFTGTFTSGAPARIGARTSGQYFFSGAMDDLKVFNSVLTAAEIAALRCGSYITTTPTHYYNYNEASGTTAANTGSAGANNGTLQNGLVLGTVSTIPSPIGCPPAATGISLSGTLTEGQTVTGNYTYVDVDSDPQGASTFQWYTATDATCTTAKTAIAGATSQTYVLTSSEVGKYVCFEITPVASSGVSPGMAVLGTSTGLVVANTAPTATGVSLTGTLQVGQTVTGNYTYVDVDNDPQGSSIFQWYAALDGICTTAKTAIAGATSQTYVLTSSEVGKSVCFEVTPVASSGTTPGIAVLGISSSAVASLPVIPPSTPVTPTPISVPPLPPMTLTVSVSGAGTGSLTGNPAGIDCSPTSSACTYTVTTPTWITLTATPGEGSQLSGWSGDSACQADGKVFVMADTACQATFELKSYELTVGRLGQGQVKGTGFDCPPDCIETVLYGTEIQLEAVADREWIQIGWKGSCDQTGKLTVTNALLCQAVFKEDPAVPNQLDGNGDGIPDAHQPNVISLPDKVGGNYVTFAVQPETCVISQIDTELPDSYGNYDQQKKPLAQGLIAFDLACPQAQVSLYYHALSVVKRNFVFRKFGPTVPGNEETVDWYLLPKVTFEAVMIGGKSVVKASYTLKDGELGDSTGVDGRIVDPGGLMVK